MKAIAQKCLSVLFSTELSFISMFIFDVEYILESAYNLGEKLDVLHWMG